MVRWKWPISSRNDYRDQPVSILKPRCGTILIKFARFTAANHELIILYISHTLDSDNNYVSLSQAQWNSLFQQLTGINNLFVTSNPPSDLTDLTLSQLLPQNSASVLVVAELGNGISLGDYASKGIYSSSSFPHFDSYSDSDNVQTMETDQLAKLASNRNVAATNTKDQFHLLSWTLTQQDPLGDAIVNIAVSVYDDLFSTAFNAFTPTSFPNVLYMDAFACRDRAVTNPLKSKPDSVPAYWDVAALAMAVNFGVAGRNSFVTGK
jgi:hypothetical protein